MIKAVVFDIGDVVLREHGWEARKVLADKFGFSEEEFGKFACEKLKDSYVGKFSAKEFFGELKSFLKIEASIEELIEAWKVVRLESTRYNEGMKEFVQSLRGSYVLASLTDTTVLNDVVRRDFGVYDLFDFNVTSPEVGFRKPDREIYEELLVRLKERGIETDEVVFIDDEMKNLEPAMELGMKTVLFSAGNEDDGFERMMGKLMELGVEV